MGLQFQPLASGVSLRQTYTSSTTFSAPASSNINNPLIGYVVCIGGGGSGAIGRNLSQDIGAGGYGGATTAGGGGGGGYIGFGTVPLIGTTTITIGAGATAVTGTLAAGSVGNSGGSTSVAGIFGYQGLGGGRAWTGCVIGSTITSGGVTIGGSGGSGGGGGGNGGYNTAIGGPSGTGGVGGAGGTLGATGSIGTVSTGFNTNVGGGSVNSGAGTTSLLANWLPGGGGGGGGGNNFVSTATLGGAGGVAGLVGGAGGAGGVGGVAPTATTVQIGGNGSSGTGRGSGGGGGGGIGGGKSLDTGDGTVNTSTSGAGTSGVVYLYY